MDKKTIVFDFGGVVFAGSARRFYAARFAASGRSAAELDHFLTHVFTDRERSQSNTGNAADLVARKTAEYPAYADDIRAYLDEFPATVSGVMPGMAAALQDIAAAGHRIVGLTNWHGDTYDMLAAAYPDVLRHFNAVVVSGKIGMRKPDPAIFAHAHKAFGNPDPADVIYFDDKPANVDAARQAVGWTGVVFSGADDLRRILAIAPRTA